MKIYVNAVAAELMGVSEHMRLFIRTTLEIDISWSREALQDGRNQP